jgi:hypothetical protein
MDEDLKRVAEAAAEFVAGGENPLTDFLNAIDPPTVLSLLSRLSAAAERERELVEALTVLVARYGYEDDNITPKDWSEWAEAQALLPKDPTP